MAQGCPCEANEVLPWALAFLLLGAFLAWAFSQQSPTSTFTASAVPNVSVVRDELGRILSIRGS